jgi:hypothetical protein
LQKVAFVDGYASLQEKNLYFLSSASDDLS